MEKPIVFENTLEVQTPNKKLAVSLLCFFIFIVFV